MIEIILRAMSHQGDKGDAVVPQPIPEGLMGAPPRILAAEDNEFNRDLLEHLL